MSDEGARLRDDFAELRRQAAASMPDVSTTLARARAGSSRDTQRSRVGSLVGVACAALALVLVLDWGQRVESESPLDILQVVDPDTHLMGLGDWYTHSDELLETTGSDVLRGWPTDPWNAVEDGHLFDPRPGEPETRSEVPRRFQA